MNEPPYGEKAAIDIDAYLGRIAYDGDRQPTLENLRAMQLLHTRAIAFENLNPLMRWPVPLDAPALEDKIVRCGRGGYCFEQNLLLRHVLIGLGYAVTGLAARVVWNAPPGIVNARSHMLLRVAIDGDEFLVDVGFGLTPTAPLHFETGTAQATPHGNYQLLDTPKGFVLQAQLGGQWTPLYVFDLQEQEQRDYEVANWFVSTHPESHFLHELMAARAAPECRYALRNNEFTVREVNGRAERRVIRDAGELRRLLQQAFLLTLPQARELDNALARIAALEAAAPAAS